MYELRNIMWNAQNKIFLTISNMFLLIAINASCSITHAGVPMPPLPELFSLKLSYSCADSTTEYCRTSASPLIKNGIIYARAFDEYVYSIDQMTGKIAGKYNTEQLSFSTPTIQDGFLYASAWYLYAFDQNTTSLKWKKVWAINTTPTIYNGSLILGVRDGVVSVDRWTGNTKWEFKSTYPDDPYFSSPLIHNGHVFVGSYSPSQMGKTGFYSINAETGQVERVLRYGYDYYATPCAINNTIYVGNKANEFYAINQNTGAVQWSYTDKESVLTQFITSPYCDVDKVYISSSGSNDEARFYAFDGKSGKIIWTFKPQRNGNITHSIEIKSSPTVKNDVVFFGCDNHYLYALNKNTGELKWKFKADAEIRSKPTIDNGVVYFTTLSGTLYAIDEVTGLMHKDRK